MMNHPQQPREFDAVLGDQSPLLEGAAVLGGIEGVKLRLINPDPKVRIAALGQALNYGEQGLDLVIQALNDEFWDVQRQAYSLLKSLLTILLPSPLRLKDESSPVQNAAYSFLTSQTKARLKQVLIESDVHLRLRGIIDYTRLSDLLAAEKWKEANEETRRIMLVAAYEKQEKNWLNFESIANFSCEDLRIIDQLWVKHSNGRFGFSVQKRIYQSLGGYGHWHCSDSVWCAFCDRVGWRKRGNWLYNKDITVDKTVPEGHLPLLRLGSTWEHYWSAIESYAYYSSMKESEWDLDWKFYDLDDPDYGLDLEEELYDLDSEVNLMEADLWNEERMLAGDLFSRVETCKL